mmetsp:Transcript_432/g.1111  ORF Transcript_432/g.1111 Transcript_432/m.1111 type:complete len:110 (-) Transcript_432:124-453(-)
MHCFKVGGMCCGCTTEPLHPLLKNMRSGCERLTGVLPVCEQTECLLKHLSWSCMHTVFSYAALMHVSSTLFVIARQIGRVCLIALDAAGKREKERLCRPNLGIFLAKVP